MLHEEIIGYTYYDLSHCHNTQQQKTFRKTPVSLFAWNKTDLKTN